MSTEQQAQKTVAFVLYPGLTVLDLIGPLQVLTTLGSIAPNTGRSWWRSASSPRTRMSPER